MNKHPGRKTCSNTESEIQPGLAGDNRGGGKTTANVAAAAPVGQGRREGRRGVAGCCTTTQDRPTDEEVNEKPEGGGGLASSAPHHRGRRWGGLSLHVQSRDKQILQCIVESEVASHTHPPSAQQQAVLEDL